VEEYLMETKFLPGFMMKTIFISRF